MAESLTRKIYEELMSGSGTEEGRCRNLVQGKKAMQKKSVGSSSVIESKEQKLRRIIDFGRGFYSIAQAAGVTHRSKHSIRRLLRDGKLTGLSFPNTSGRFISGVELTELVIQHNLKPEVNVVDWRPDFVRRVK